MTRFTRPGRGGVPFERLFPGRSRALGLPAGALCSFECRHPSCTPASPRTHRLLQTRFAASRGTPPAIDSYGLRDSSIALMSRRGAAGDRHPEPRRPRVVDGGMPVQPARNLACVRSSPTAAHRRFRANHVPDQQIVKSPNTSVTYALSTSLQTFHFALSTFPWARRRPDSPRRLRHLCT